MSLLKRNVICIGVLLLISGMLGLVQGQTAHKALTREVLKDFHQFVMDTLKLDPSQVTYDWEKETATGKYLGNMLTGESEQSTDGGGILPIPVRIEGLSLAINMLPPANGNYRYSRQLNLQLTFTRADQPYQWKGSIMDKLTVNELVALLEESYPVELSGDFNSKQPSGLMIGLTLATVFALVASLYFVRT